MTDANQTALYPSWRKRIPWTLLGAIGAISSFWIHSPVGVMLFVVSCGLTMCLWYPWEALTNAE